MDYTTFKKEIDAGKYRPAYLFTARKENFDDYLAEQGVRALVEKLVPEEERMLNLTTVYGGEAGELSQTLASPPMFGANRVTVVRDAERLSGEPLDAAIRFMKNPSSDSFLLLWVAVEDKRKSFFKNAAKLAETVNCIKLKGRETMRWMNEYVAGLGKKLDQEAVGQLSTVNWPSLRELASELDRLALMTGENPVIKLADVREMGGSSFALERWALADAVGQGNRAEAIRVFNNMQYWGVKPTQVIFDLYRLFHNLWLLKWMSDHRRIDKAAEMVQLHPFVLKKYTGYAQRAKMKGLEDGLMRILEADLNVKRGVRQGEQEVVLLLVDLTTSIR